MQQAPGSPSPRSGSGSKAINRLSTVLGVFCVVYEFGFDHLQHPILIGYGMMALGAIKTTEFWLVTLLSRNRMSLSIGPLRWENEPMPIVDEIKIPVPTLPESLRDLPTSPSPIKLSSSSSRDDSPASPSASPPP